MSEWRDCAFALLCFALLCNSRKQGRRRRQSMGAAAAAPTTNQSLLTVGALVVRRHGCCLRREGSRVLSLAACPVCEREKGDSTKNERKSCEREKRESESEVSLSFLGHDLSRSRSLLPPFSLSEALFLLFFLLCRTCEHFFLSTLLV